MNHFFKQVKKGSTRWVSLIEPFLSFWRRAFKKTGDMRQNKIMTFIVLSGLTVFLAGLWAQYNQYAPTALPRLEQSSNGEAVNTSEKEAPQTSEENHFINILIIGVDKHGMGDLIMIGSFNMVSHQTTMIAVSRHTYVADQDWEDYDEGRNHLCFANYYGMGPEEDYHQGAIYTASWVQHLFDVPLHGYVSVTYEALIELIDRIGGVEIYVHPDFADIKPSSSHNITEPLPTGLQRLSGEQAYFFAGYRGGDGDRIPELGSETEDGDRIRRNQRLLRAAVAQVKTLNLIEILHIIRHMPKSVYTNLDAWDLAHLAPLVYKVKADEIITIVLPGELEQLEHPAGLGLLPFYYHIDYEMAEQVLTGLGLK